MFDAIELKFWGHLEAPYALDIIISPMIIAIVPAILFNPMFSFNIRLESTNTSI
jgi:hypothetical protein